MREIPCAPSPRQGLLYPCKSLAILIHSQHLNHHVLHHLLTGLQQTPPRLTRAFYLEDPQAQLDASCCDYLPWIESAHSASVAVVKVAPGLPHDLLDTRVPFEFEEQGVHVAMRCLQ